MIATSPKQANLDMHDRLALAQIICLTARACGLEFDEVVQKGQASAKALLPKRTGTTNGS